MAVDSGNPGPIHHLLRTVVPVRHLTFAEDPCRPEEAATHSSRSIHGNEFAYAFFHSRVRVAFPVTKDSILWSRSCIYICSVPMRATLATALQFRGRPFTGRRISSPEQLRGITISSRKSIRHTPIIGHAIARPVSPTYVIKIGVWMKSGAPQQLHRTHRGRLFEEKKHP